MDKEIKDLLLQVKSTHEEYKATVDANEKKADALLEEKAKKIETFITEAQEKISTLEKASARKGLDLENNGVNEFAVKAFNKYMAFGEKSMTAEEVKAMSIGNSSEGGYLIQPELLSLINARIQETSPIRQLANVVSTSADSIEIPFTDNKIDSGWVGETSSRAETATNSPIGQAKISVYELYSKPKATQRFLDTVTGGEQVILDLVAETMMLSENTAFVSGNGVVKPVGFLTNTVVSTQATPASYSATNVEAMKSGSSGSFDADDLIDLVYRLKSAYRQNASWLMNRLTVASVMKLKDSYGQYLWRPSLAVGQPATLQGFPVYEATDMPVVAADSLSIAFGDFRKAYTIVDGTRMTMLRDPFSAKPFVEFYTTKAVGGGVVVAEAIKLLKLSS